MPKKKARRSAAKTRRPQRKGAHPCRKCKCSDYLPIAGGDYCGREHCQHARLDHKNEIPVRVKT
jgi:hypothetical protein